MYKQVKNAITGVVCGVSKPKDDDGTIFIPFAEDNTDYQAYLKWVAKGNTPEPADEPSQGA